MNLNRELALEQLETAIHCLREASGHMARDKSSGATWLFERLNEARDAALEARHRLEMWR